VEGQVDRPFESLVADRLGKFRGKTVAEIGTLVGVRPTVAKHYTAMVLRELAAHATPSGNLADFDSRGIEVKTVRAPAGGRPFESMSFPAFRNHELSEENWARATLRRYLRRLLVLRVTAPVRETPQGRSVFTGLRFWSPDEDQLSGIGTEWEMFRSMISGGQARRIPAESSTRFIHLRPKARDKDDVEPAPSSGFVVRKSFWLNRDFVSTIIEGTA